MTPKERAMAPSFNLPLIIVLAILDLFLFIGWLSRSW